jgi:hypothetical protein
VARALRLVNGYLESRLPMLFKPILEYLGAAGGARTATELDTYFRKKLQADTIGAAYEWLAEKGVIQQVATPLRLVEKSRVTVDEAAYYYDSTEEPRTGTRRVNQEPDAA